MLYLNKITFCKDKIFNKIKLRLFSIINNETLTEWDEIKSKYSVKQLKYIFKELMMTSSNTLRLKRYNLTNDEIHIISSLNLKNKVCQSLDDIVSSNLLKVSELAIICDALMKRRYDKFNGISVMLGKNNFKELKTTVGIRIGVYYISWAQLDLNGSHCNILDWKCVQLSVRSFGGSSPEIIKKGMNMVDKIPNANAYVMEKEPLRIPHGKINATMFRLILQKQQLLSAILTGLFMRHNFHNHKATSTFYVLRQLSSAQRFQIYFGRETVSSTKVVEAILKKKDTGQILSVSAIDEVFRYYKKLDFYGREEINTTLLMTLTFLEKVFQENKLEK